MIEKIYISEVKIKGEKFCKFYKPGVCPYQCNSCDCDVVDIPQLSLVWVLGTILLSKWVFQPVLSFPMPQLDFYKYFG